MTLFARSLNVPTHARRMSLYVAHNSVPTALLLRIINVRTNCWSYAQLRLLLNSEWWSARRSQRKKQSQYEIEQEEVRASVATIHAHEECLKMLAAEAQAAATTRKEVLAASKAANAAKASATDALSALRQKSKERLHPFAPPLPPKLKFATRKWRTRKT